MNSHSVLRVVSKLLMPPILLFALYVQFHGDFGAGGGFQAGVIFSAALILYTLIFGLRFSRAVLPPRLLRIGLCVGVLLYGGTGVACMFLGGNFLDYSVLAEKSYQGQHIGIILVELGVGIAVACAMFGIFLLFAAQDHLTGDEATGVDE